jgi:hypothetical protein
MEVGFPIRTSADQRSLASPRGFSQRATSFIASWRQGIHRTPFIHSILATTQPARRTKTLKSAPCSREHHRDAASNIRDAHMYSLHSTMLRPVPRPAKTARPILVANTRSYSPCQRSPGTRHRPSVSTGCPVGVPLDHATRLLGARQRTCSGVQRALPSGKPPCPATWRRSGSNRRPPACKAGALPAELRPRTPPGQHRQPVSRPTREWAREDLNLRPHAYQACALTN